MRPEFKPQKCQKKKKKEKPHQKIENESEDTHSVAHGRHQLDAVNTALSEQSRSTIALSGE
jgi:hypothetical protein